MAIGTLVKKENDLFGLCSKFAEIFREGGFEVYVYPEYLDEMDSSDKPDVNLIVYGDANERGKVSKIIDVLIKEGNKIISQGNHSNLCREEKSKWGYHCLFDAGGKRIKIRDQTSYNEN